MVPSSRFVSLESAYRGTPTCGRSLIRFKSRPKGRVVPFLENPSDSAVRDFHEPIGERACPLSTCRLVGGMGWG